MLNYPETLDYLFALHRFGVKLGLEPITKILHRLGQPQHQYATLHVGGTNGKGSSAAMLAAMLQAGGYRVGLYTSPHLVDFRERIRVQNNDISEEHVCELTERIRRLTDTLESLTFFEMTTAMAFQYFSDQRVDIAVIEVGLGGRYDATNVLDPLGVLITGIAFDHERYLGGTLPEIAREKAGIIHSRVPVVLGAVSDSVKSVFETSTQHSDATLFQYGQDFSISQSGQGTFTYHGIREEIPDLKSNLLGQHQVSNAACALALIESSTRKKFPLSVKDIQYGLEHVRWKGRLEILQRDPMVIVDGAHNPWGARVLFDFLYSQLHDCSDRKIIVILGMMDDKHHAEFVQVLLPLISTLILTQPHMNRAVTADELRQVVPPGDVGIITVDDSWEAYCQALRIARPWDLICVTGSLFLVGEILHHLTQRSSPMSKSENV